MKKTFEYVGLFVLVAFSFYYTERVVQMVNFNDPLMEEISEYAKTVNKSCVEGYVAEDGIVLGVNGLLVDEDKSYKNMKGFGFSEDLVVFKEDVCSINNEEFNDKYIIKGNESSNSVSIIVLVNDGSLLESFVSIAKINDVKLTFAVSGSVVETYKTFFEKYILDGHTLVYSGNDETDLKKFLSIIKDLNKKQTLYCLNANNYDIREICKKEKINTIKSEYIYYKNILVNTKQTLQKGNIYIYKENKNVYEEFSTTIKHIKGKGIKIKTIEEII